MVGVRIAGPFPLLYGARMPSGRPEDLLDHDVPDLALPASTGGEFRFGTAIGKGPLVLFFYIRNASPG